MNEETLKKIAVQLADHDKRIAQLEVVGETSMGRASRSIKTGGKKRKDGATGPIKQLIAGGFFAAGKTDVEIQKALRQQARKFDRNDIAATLIKLIRQDILKRDGGGKNSNPWKYKIP